MSWKLWLLHYTLHNTLHVNKYPIFGYHTMPKTNLSHIYINIRNMGNSGYILKVYIIADVCCIDSHTILFDFLNIFFL